MWTDLPCRFRFISYLNRDVFKLGKHRSLITWKASYDEVCNIIAYSSSKIVVNLAYRIFQEMSKRFCLDLVCRHAFVDE